MKLRPPVYERRTELTVLPMVNVVFLLLIFFMLVGRIAPVEELNVSPPVSLGGEHMSGQPVSIVIDQEGRMLLDGDRVDMTQLIITVTQKMFEDPSTKFQLKADASLDANELIRIMETLRRSRVRELSLVTRRQT